MTGPGTYGTERGSQLVLVRIYGPKGGFFDSIRMDGRSLDETAEIHDLDGRPVLTVVVLLSNRDDVVINWTMTSGENQSGDVHLGMTPSIVPGNNDDIAAGVLAHAAPVRPQSGCSPDCCGQSIDPGDDAELKGPAVDGVGRNPVREFDRQRRADSSRIAFSLNDATGSEMSYYLRCWAELRSTCLPSGQQALSSTLTLQPGDLTGRGSEVAGVGDGSETYGSERRSQLVL